MVTHNTVTLNGGAYKALPTIYFPVVFNEIYFAAINCVKTGTDGNVPTSSTFIVLPEVINNNLIWYGLKNNASGDKSICRKQFILAIGY